MSSIKLKHSGGNAVSLNPPTSAPTSAEVAFKLPNEDGSANQLLKTDGSGNLGWATDQSGKILQHKSAFKTDMSSHTGDTFGAISGLSISFAKTAASNKLLVFANINGGRDGTIWIQFKLFQDASEITALNNSGGGSYSSFIKWYSDNANGNHGAADNANINGAALFDGANDTNAHTYQIYGSTRTSGRVMDVNRRGQTTDYSGTSCLTIFEVAS